MVYSQCWCGDSRVSVGRVRGVAVEGLSGRYRIQHEPVRVRWLLGSACAGWLLVTTMPFWWAWLWQRVGLISVPLDTMVWIVSFITTVLATPLLVRRFHPGLVLTIVAVLLVGGTTIVLGPWHDVVGKAWLRMVCGSGDCATTAPTPVVWRIVSDSPGPAKPK